MAAMSTEEGAEKLTFDGGHFTFWYLVEPMKTGPQTLRVGSMANTLENYSPCS